MRSMKKRSTSFGVHNIAQMQYSKGTVNSNMNVTNEAGGGGYPHRINDIDMSAQKPQFPGHLSPTDFVTPRNQQNIGIGMPNLTIGLGGGQTGSILNNTMKKQTQLPQLQVLPIKNIQHMAVAQNGLQGVNSGTMNNPQKVNQMGQFQRDNSQGGHHRRQSSSNFRVASQALN